MISPGPVLGHMLPEDLDRLPRPIVAYGLIPTADMVAALLERAAAVVVSATTAARLTRDLLGGAGVPGVEPDPAIANPAIGP